MKLPADEKEDEEVMRVPEALEVGAFPLLHGVVNHNTEGNGHYPTSDAGSSGKVGVEEGDELGTGCLCVRICHRKSVKVDHVREDMHCSAGNDRPGGGLMERDVLVEGNDLVKRCTTEEGDKIAADGEQDEDDINM